LLLAVWVAVWVAAAGVWVAAAGVWVQDLKENLKVTKHSSDLAKGELTIKLTDMDVRTTAQI